MSEPDELAALVRTEAPQTLRRAASALPDQESCFRIWLACFAFRINVLPQDLLSDPRFIARADALIAVRKSAESA
ncbi:hypothetical protein KCG44_06230 [Pacificimonas sp. WHA3]|uniref:Uncharacterized protein n=1 Tax=Pacificimonas pallii TaxID=2827236 RepID=A0ABS6SET8_9SPHN|nr:hypothetical protein [Pacificimonas pallii]MBV7256382.1 hypothetical protein [Pacificimonas pallii]